MNLGAFSGGPINAITDHATDNGQHRSASNIELFLRNPLDSTPGGAANLIDVLLTWHEQNHSGANPPEQTIFLAHKRCLYMRPQSLQHLVADIASKASVDRLEAIHHERARHFDHEIVVLCVRWYLSFKLSYRDLVE